MKIKKCPRCNSDKINMEKQGTVTYCYEKGKIKHIFHDMEVTLFLCLDCEWMEYDER